MDLSILHAATERVVHASIRRHLKCVLSKSTNIQFEQWNAPHSQMLCSEKSGSTGTIILHKFCSSAHIPRMIRKAIKPRLSFYALYIEL